MKCSFHFGPGLPWREMVEIFEEESGGDRKFLKSAKEYASRRGWIYYTGSYWVYRTYRKARNQVESWDRATRHWLDVKQRLANRAAHAVFEEGWEKEVLRLRLMMKYLEGLDPKTFKEEGWEPNEIDLLALMAEQEVCDE